MHVGDRVRLKPNVAKTFTTPTRPRQVDWTKRVGEVVSLGQVNEIVTVRWDGRRSFDHWPKRALTVIK